MYQISRSIKPFRHKMTSLLGCSFLLVLLFGCGMARAENKNPNLSWATRIKQPSYLDQFVGRWIVITGGDTTLEGALAMRKGVLQHASILDSTLFEGLNPGWFILAMGAKVQKSEALALMKHLRKQGQEAYLRYVKRRFLWDGWGYRVGSFPRAHDVKARVGCVLHKGKRAPHGRFSLVSQEIDPTSAKVGLQQPGSKTIRWLKGLESPVGQGIYWSSKGRYVAYFSYDQYAGDGAQSLVLIDTKRDLWQKIDVKKIKHNKSRKIGKRQYYDLKAGCWSAKSGRFFFRLFVDYLGYSGHPGIDYGRKKELGRLFNKRSPIKLGDYVIFFLPR